MYESTLGLLDKKDGTRVSVYEFLNDIKSGKYLSFIEAIRNAPPEEAAELKRHTLPGLYPGSLFKSGVPPKRYTNCLAEQFERNTGVICLDYDDVEKTSEEKDGAFTTPAGIVEDYEGLPYTIGAFLSPSGTGVKVLLAVPSTKTYTDYSRLKKATLPYLIRQDLLDKSCLNNANQKCFASYDPYAYVNNKPERLYVEIPSFIEYTPSVRLSEDKLRLLVDLLEPAIPYIKVKNYNDYFMLGSACARYGLKDFFLRTLENNDWTQYRGVFKKFDPRRAEKDYHIYEDSTTRRRENGLPCVGLQGLFNLAKRYGYEIPPRTAALTATILKGG